MSEQISTVLVDQNDIIVAAHAQYLESDGGTHALVLNEETNMLYYSPGGNYWDEDKVSAYDIVFFHFNDDEKDPFEAIEDTEIMTDTVDFYGEKYNVEIINNQYFPNPDS